MERWQQWVSDRSPRLFAAAAARVMVLTCLGL